MKPPDRYSPSYRKDELTTIFQHARRGESLCYPVQVGNFEGQAPASRGGLRIVAPQDHQATVAAAQIGGHQQRVAFAAHADRHFQADDVAIPIDKPGPIAGAEFGGIQSRGAHGTIVVMREQCRQE